MLKSPILFDRTIATPYGEVTFDSKGNSVELDMSVEDQQALAKLPYLTYEKLSPKPEPVKETVKKAKGPVKETKEETKAPVKETKEETKEETKAPVKKATRTRKTTKATEK